MKKKKYFSLIIILLTGVVLLSGCSGGSSDSNSNLSDLEAEAVIQSTFNDIADDNFSEAENHFAADFEFESYDESIGLHEFLSSFEDKVNLEKEKKYTVTNIEVNNLILISSASEKTFQAEIIIKGYTIDYIDNYEKAEELKHDMIIILNSQNSIEKIKLI